MQIEYLANMEFNYRERQMKWRLPRVRIIREGIGKEPEGTGRRNKIRQLLHLD
jgi:hypothetical protein